MALAETYANLKHLARSKLGIIELHSSYRTVFGTPDGKRVLRHLCKRAFVYDSTFSKDANEMAFREGQRALALAIVRYVSKDTDKLLKEIEDYHEDTV